MRLPPKIKKRTSNTRKGTANPLISTWTWTVSSRLYRQVNPLCAICEAQGLLSDATPGARKGVVDHIIRVNAGGAMYDNRNMMTICRSHHDAKSRLEGKGWTCDMIGTYGSLVPANRSKVIADLALALRARHGRNDGGRGEGK